MQKSKRENNRGAEKFAFSLGTNAEIYRKSEGVQQPFPRFFQSEKV